MASGATLSVSGANLSTPGTITNNGTIVLGSGVTLSSSGTFTNNGTLDLTNDPTYVLPSNLVNHGTVLRSNTGGVDSPTMPPWALVVTAGLLLLAANGKSGKRLWVWTRAEPTEGDRFLCTRDAALAHPGNK